jgi:hypothetical protein
MHFNPVSTIADNDRKAKAASLAMTDNCVARFHFNQ